MYIKRDNIEDLPFNRVVKIAVHQFNSLQSRETRNGSVVTLSSIVAEPLWRYAYIRINDAGKGFKAVHACP